MSGRWAQIAAALVLALTVAGAQAHHKPESSEGPDVAAIQPADVVFIGDSQNLGYFGAQLYRSLSAAPDPKSGHTLTVWGYWVCGSDVEEWLAGGKSYCGVRVCDAADRCTADYGPLDRPGDIRYAPLSAYAAKVRPRLTIISLGSNLLTWKLSEFRDEYASYLDGAGRLAAQIAQGGSQCIWIGPPQTATSTKPLATYEKYVADLRQAVTARGCAFIDSNPLSDRQFVLRSDPEGIHYNGVGERSWEHKVWAQLRPLLLARLAH